MPRLNYGNAVKQRANQFFTVLVDYANDELDCDDRQLDNLHRDIQLHWQTEKRCVVRTKVRYLENLMRLAGSALTGEQIKESIKCLTDFLGIIDDNRPSKGGSETWHFTLNLWYDRFDRSANLHKFDTEWEHRKSPQNIVESQRLPAEVDPKSKILLGATHAEEASARLHPQNPKSEIWLDLVRSSLTDRQYHRITTNPLMGSDELKFSLEEVYVPLGLMERQSPTIFDVRDDRADEGEAVSMRTISDVDRLLAQLAANSHPNRIGIIGEPGSGKTTCLQRLAAGLLDLQLLPIWISLADLQGETLENYLLQDWLKTATKQVNVDPQLQQDLAVQCDRGRVWLLLDAVDEMAVDASTSLTNLARQVRGWVGTAHIILTCRSNVWDSGKNALENFTTYRNLSLSYGYTQPQNQVRQFIQGWFKDRPNLGDNLAIELAQPQYQRLRDAVKNPLRLALLCRSWVLTQGKLPSTKSSLYQQFTETIYEWKQDYFPTTLAQRQQLNRALSKLALSAIEIERIRFRLPHDFVIEILEPDLLELALQLGWLNRVGISATTGAKIYAFYHPTFQEYFAAQAIDEWQYFFPNQDRVTTPIFSPYWRETILFWVGRSDVSIADKEACITALINFDSNCGNFYAYRAYFLAAAAIAEFPESRSSRVIIDRLLEWRFARFIPDGNFWEYYPAPIQDGARLALRQTDRLAAIAGLEKFLRSVNNPFLRWQAAYSLGKVFDPGNALAIEILTDSLQAVDRSDLAIKICESLVKIDPQPNRMAIDTLATIVQTSDRESIRRKAAFTLGKLLVEIELTDEYRSLLSQVINVLVETIAAATERANRIAALDNLRQIAPTHPAAQQQLPTDRTPPSSTRDRHKKVARERNISIAIAELEQKLANVDNPESQRRYAYQLGKFQPGHPLAVSALLQLMSTPQLSSFYKRTGEYLREIILDEQLALIVTQLQSAELAVENGDRSNSTLECYKLLWDCADRLPYLVFERIWQDEL
jgi:predicted NACHT family NTPase